MFPCSQHQALADHEFHVILGDHPAADALANRMRDHGWHKVELRSELNMLTTQSWQKGDCLATDVRPENAILAEADGQIYPFDFIMSRKQ